MQRGRTGWVRPIVPVGVVHSRAMSSTLAGELHSVE